MSHTPQTRTLRRLILLGFSIFVLLLALSAAPSQVAACVSCFQESGTAYSYCQAHPGPDYYEGCNFSISCKVHWQSASQIYYLECVE
jgi:hypothetical protein